MWLWKVMNTRFIIWRQLRRFFQWKIITLKIRHETVWWIFISRPFYFSEDGFIQDNLVELLNSDLNIEDHFARFTSNLHRFDQLKHFSLLRRFKKRLNIYGNLVALYIYT